MGMELPATGCFVLGTSSRDGDFPGVSHLAASLKNTVDRLDKKGF